MFDLTGRRIVITGASRGIGEALAVGLTEAGASVALWGRDAGRLAEPAARCGGVAVTCDVTSREDVERAYAQTVDALGGVDGVIANAGRPGEDVPFEEVTLEQWDAVLATNLTGCFHTVQAGAKQMIAAGTGGKIVVISSMGAEYAMGRAPAYAASKAGVLALTRAAAARLARYDIQVNAIMPGWIETEMAAPQLESDTVGPALRKRTPARRFGRPDELVGISAYLLSDASSFHTGDSIRVDGGFLIA